MAMPSSLRLTSEEAARFGRALLSAVGAVEITAPPDIEPGGVPELAGENSIGDRSADRA
ncbi:hypothetical protein TA3x_004462 [Tundrisphaera sp. TA3]|uniref:hypothetical protein n=1 Tax=Tundrisphaera sp. TA3 TaxID=3435775 RepID=UPI003EBA5C1A